MVLNGLPGLYGLKYDHVIVSVVGALINWSILSQVVLEQDLTLFAACVFKTKVFVFQNQFLATHSYI